MAAGANGFAGEGYRHHKLLRPFGHTFLRCTPVSKTTTFPPREGNIPMREDGITPKEFSPKCILPNLEFKHLPLSLRMFIRGYMLNAVGLSGPGAKALLEMGIWQKIEENHFLSFMSVATTPEERLDELKKFVQLLMLHLPDFRARIGLQMNYSCPNVGLDPSLLVDEAIAGLNVASELDIPLMPKFNLLALPKAVAKICENRHCHAICFPNTVPFGKLPDRIDWKKLFGSDVSPLAEFGGGGLSGAPLMHLTKEWLEDARHAGVRKHINASCGLGPRDVRTLYYAGADSVFLSSISTLRFWRMKSTIREAHLLFGD